LASQVFDLLMCFIAVETTVLYLAYWDGVALKEIDSNIGLDACSIVSFTAPLIALKRRLFNFFQHACGMSRSSTLGCHSKLLQNTGMLPSLEHFLRQSDVVYNSCGLDKYIFDVFLPPHIPLEKVFPRVFILIWL